MGAAVLAFALLALTAPPGLPQQPVDTTLTLQGFLQHDDDAGAWTIVVPSSIRLLGTRTYVVPVVGKPERWSRYVNQYIEANGRVTSLPERTSPPIGMEIDKAKQVAPPGTAHAVVDHGMTLHADVTLSVIPNTISWRDSAGAPTGVNPMLLYTIINQRTTPIYFYLPSNRYLCVTLQTADGVRLWDSTTYVLSPDQRRFTLQRAGGFRDAIHFPEDAAARRGHYVVQMGICEVDDYDIKAEFDVR